MRRQLNCWRKKAIWEFWQQLMPQCTGMQACLTVAFSFFLNGAFLSLFVAYSHHKRHLSCPEVFETLISVRISKPRHIWYSDSNIETESGKHLRNATVNGSFFCRKTAEKVGVEGYPTFAYFKDGKFAWKINERTKDGFYAFMKKYVACSGFFLGIWKESQVNMMFMSDSTYLDSVATIRIRLLVSLSIRQNFQFR